MGREHSYTVDLTWTGNRGSGTTGYRDYARDVAISTEGKHPIDGSSDKPFRGDPTRWNPEELLLISLSQCHLLSYLHAAVTAGIVVTGYRDAPTGTMAEDGRGGGAFTEVTLHPHVTVASEEMIPAAQAAHRQASEWCFIAASVNFPVTHEPTILVASV